MYIFFFSIFSGKKELLSVYKTNYARDTGSYKCIGKNQAGKSADVSSLFILGRNDRFAGMGYTEHNFGKFTVFHSQGYTAYNPNNCQKYHR